MANSLSNQIHAGNPAMGSGLLAQGAFAGAGAGAGAGAMRPRTEQEGFQDFCKSEQAYHKAMADMYEWLLAQDLMRGDKDSSGELLRTIFTAGLHSLAGQHRG